MACACKTNSDLKYLQKNFGYNKTEDGEEATFNIGKFLIKVFVGIITIIAIPFMLLSVFYYSVIKKQKVIQIEKIFGLKKQ